MSILNYELFNVLVKSLPEACIFDHQTKKEIDGSLDEFDSCVGLVYCLFQKNKNFITNIIDDKPVKYYLMEAVKRISLDEYHDHMSDEKLTTEELNHETYIIEILLKNIESSRNHYYSNGAYNMYGITQIVLFTLLKTALDA